LTVLLAIARRELASLLLSPAGWFIVSLFLFFVGGVSFMLAPHLLGTGFRQGQPATLRLFFETATWVFLVIAPALTMRSIAEETRQGTLELLLSAPIREHQIILGKFFGALGFLVVMLLPTLLYVIPLEWYGEPDYGELACGYGGLLLSGAACLASGLLASTVTASQVLAYMLSVFLWLLVLLVTIGTPALGQALADLAPADDPGALVSRLAGWVTAVGDFVEAGNPLRAQHSFTIGLVDSFGIAFFSAWCAAFLGASIHLLALRRWP